jgi:lysyl-tRNA synthetase class I
MRNWVDGPHFPDAAKIVVQSSVGEEARANLTEAHEEFLSALSKALADCEWTDGAIADCIRATIGEEGIGGRDAYVALYWAILGKHHGPKASSLMAEMNRNQMLSLISLNSEN